MKPFVVIGICLAVAACSRESRIAKTSARAPATRVAPVTDTLHGVQIADRYRWLEGDNSDPNDPGRMTPEVSAWTDAQNRYTRSVLDNLPGRKALEDRLAPLMDTGSVTAPIVRGNRYFFWNREVAQPLPILYWRHGALGADKVLIDAIALDPSGRTTVGWFWPSEDGKLLAYGVYRAGDPGSTLHLLDVDAAKRLPLEIRNSPHGVQWLPDGSGFVYQNLRSADDPNSRQVMFHRTGAAPEHDVVLFRQFMAAENARLGSTAGPFATLSRDGRWLVTGYWVDGKSNDLWVADFAAFRKTGKLPAKIASVGVAGTASGTVIDGTLFLHTTKGAPRGRVVAVSAAAPGQPHWRDIVPERSDAAIERVSFGRAAIAVTYAKNASTVIEVFDAAGKPLGTLKQPGIGAASLSADEDRTEAYLTYASFNFPPTVFRVDLTRPGDAPARWKAPYVAADPALVEVEQVWYPAKDGTRVSMFLVHRKGLARTGSTPALLAGYGAFKVRLVPAFSPTLLQWFDAGGLFAVPNLRGGGEYGDDWHDAGRLERKQTAFDDFIAAAEWLIANKYTSAQKLAIHGGSHGGLLTGAAITQRPDLFRAALVLDPLLDMLRYHKFARQPYWISEYGSADDGGQFTWLDAYSPYRHVRPGTRYPAVLLTAADGPAEVHAMHARKMAAELQAATASDASEQPILLWVDRDAPALPALQLRAIVDQRIFIMWQLGML
jgi:prolyl oligopeptidase